MSAFPGALFNITLGNGVLLVPYFDKSYIRNFNMILNRTLESRACIPNNCVCVCIINEGSYELMMLVSDFSKCREIKGSDLGVGRNAYAGLREKVLDYAPVGNIIGQFAFLRLTNTGPMFTLR